MKKLLLLSLALMMLCCSALGESLLSMQEGALSLDAVFAKAEAEFRRITGFTQEEAAFFTYHAHQWQADGAEFEPAQDAPYDVWSVTFRYAPPENSRFLDALTQDLQLSIHLRAQDALVLSSPLDEAALAAFMARYGNYQALSADADYAARRQEAHQLAWVYMLESCGLAESEALLVTPQLRLVSPHWESPSLPIDYADAWWQVSFPLPDLPQQPALMLAVEAESRYTYLDAGNPRDYALSFRGWIQWMEKKSAAQMAAMDWALQWGDPLLWDYTKKAEFYLEYGMAPDFSAEGAQVSCDLPDEQDTPYDAALLSARQALITHLKATEAELDSLLISAQFTGQFFHPSGDRAWIFQFCGPHASLWMPDTRYTAFILSPSGEAVTVLRNVPEPGDGDYWSCLDE